VEVVASLSQGRTAAAQCGLFTYKSVPVIFEPPCTSEAKCVLKSLRIENDAFGQCLCDEVRYCEVGGT